MRTVERRSCSATSPNPGMAMLSGSKDALADHDVGFLNRAAANELERERFANGFCAKLTVNVFEARDGVARESQKNVADNDTGFVRWTFGFDFEDNGGSFVIALQRLSQRIRQTHRLQPNAKVALRNASFLQEQIHNAVHCRCGNRDGT